MNIVNELHKVGEKFAGWCNEKIHFGVNTKDDDVENIKKSYDHETLAKFLPYEAYDDENNIFINKGSCGFILEVSPLTGASEETVNILSSIVTDMLPVDTDIHIWLWASDKIGPALDQFENLRAEKGEIYEWLGKKRTDFLKEGAYKSLATGGSFIIRDFRLFIDISKPAKKNEDFVVELIQLRKDLCSSLASINMATKNLEIDQFISVMSDLISPEANVYPTRQHWHDLDSLSQQLTDPERHLVVEPSRLIFDSGVGDEWEARAFTVKDFPKSMTQWKMTESIGQLFNASLQIPCSFVVSFSIRVPGQESSKLKTQFKTMDKEKSAKSSLSKLNPILQKQHEEWDFINKRLLEGDRIVKVYYQVVLYSQADMANNSERKLRDLYKANGWNLRKDSYLQLQSWLAMMPMMMSEGMFEDLQSFGRIKTVTAFNSVNIAPLQGEWKGTRTPSLLLPGRRGQLACWSPFDNQEGNYNVAIAAASGKGKSVLTQEYIVCVVGSGGRVWVIDIGRSYEKTCKLLGGTFIEFNQEINVSLNPFTFIKDFNESLDMLKPLLSAMARPTSTASDEEITYLEKALNAAWNEKGNKASITTVAEWLNKQDQGICKNLSHLLYSYTKDGMYGRYFEGDSNIDLTNNFVVLELQELKAKKDLQKIILLVLMYQISQTMYLGSRHQQKSCIIDEAWDLLGGDNDGAAKFIEAGYRTARRYNSNFVTITQSINDYYKNSTSLAAFENSDYKLILGQNPETIDQVKQSGRMNLDAYTERLFKSLRKNDEYSECVIKSSSGISVHRIILDPYSRILYSSKGDEYEAVKALTAQGQSLLNAVDIVAKRKFAHA